MQQETGHSGENGQNAANNQNVENKLGGRRKMIKSAVGAPIIASFLASRSDAAWGPSNPLWWWATQGSQHPGQAPPPP